MLMSADTKIGWNRISVIGKDGSGSGSLSDLGLQSATLSYYLGTSKGKTSLWIFDLVSYKLSVSIKLILSYFDISRTSFGRWKL